MIVYKCNCRVVKRSSIFSQHVETPQFLIHLFAVLLMEIFIKLLLIRMDVAYYILRSYRFCFVS